MSNRRKREQITLSALENAEKQKGKSGVRPPFEYEKKIEKYTARGRMDLEVRSPVEHDQIYLPMFLQNIRVTKHNCGLIFFMC